MTAIHRTTETVRHDRGSALIWALLFVVVTSTMVISHAVYLTATRRERDVRYNQEALSATFARNGLTDMLGWLHRQPVQPVTSFDPILDPTGDPPSFDTMDPALGLVREFEVRGNLWGRYEIRHEEAVDISAQRGQSTPGSVWEVGVRSYVYRVVDPAKAFDESPNRIVSVSKMVVEMRGIPFNLPAPAAISVEEPGDLHVYPNGKILGGDHGGVAYAEPVGPALALIQPVVDPAATLSGTPSEVALPAYNASPERTFSMRLDEVKTYSDEVWRSGDEWTTRGDLSGRVIYVPGDLTIDGDRKLDGVLLVVDGNLDVVAGHDVLINGVVFVRGDAFVRGTFQLNGAMVVRGAAHIGLDSYPVVLTYDQAVVDRLRQNLVRYRMRRVVLPDQ